MGSTRRRAKRLESAISICLLAILLLIALGVFIKQSNYNMGRFGIDITAEELSLQMSEANEKRQMDLSSLTPAGFETLSRIETYNSENLYEKINGKAPLYIESEFQELFTQRFVNKDRENLWFELYVYDMGTVRNAFSVFSVQRRADADFLSLLHPSFGYRTSNALYFVHGKYYIELVGSSESAELSKAMAEVARQIRSELAVDKVMDIAELGLFPPENIIPGSVKLYLANAFGFGGLTDTLTARYKLGDETVTAFLSRCPDPQDAKKVADSYSKFLIDNGGTKISPMTVRGKLVGEMIDFYDTTEIIFATGSFVAGVHQCENEQLANELAAILFKKLTEVEIQ